MHERTSRAIARLVFVLCCAGPTLLTVGIILVTWTPWHHRRQLAQLEAVLFRELGVAVEIEDFERRSPSRWQLRGVRLLDPELGDEIARVRLVWWVREGDRTVIRLSQPELRSARLAGAWELIHDRFLCRPDLVRGTARVSANDLTIHSRSGAMTLRDVDAFLRTRANAIEGQLFCLPASAPQGAEPVQVTIVRDRSGAGPVTRCRLHSGSTPLPCSALAEHFPLFDRLGREARFAGSMVWETAPGGWTIDLGGARFEQVELGQLLAAVPHRLSGMAEFRFQRCRWTPGRVVDISGEVRAQRGYVSPSWLRALREHLGFQTVMLPDVAGDQAYDELALHFDLFGSDLELHGTCQRLDGHRHLDVGTALCVGGRPLAISGSERLLSVSLSRAIAPEHSALVPVSGQTHWLMGLLIPPKTPRESSEGLAPAAPRITAAGPFAGGGTIRQE